jgi:prepilin-type N-terminal cleavage/methylation domain-containing protein
MLKFNKKIKRNRGMTYVELIVVLSIFAVMTSVVLFNYGDFQSRVDVKNLTTDIALQIVQAQKSSIAGKLPPASQTGQWDTTWKPSYGVFFNPVPDDHDFVYFTDLGIWDNVNKVNTQNSFFDIINGPLSDAWTCAGECLSKITITKGNTISRMDYFDSSISCLPPATTCHFLGGLDITFSRNSSGPTFFNEDSQTKLPNNISYVQLTILSLKGFPSYIKIYPSGRIQIN